jgi:hypothetical protein
MLAILDESHSTARYGALFLIHPAILAAVTLTIGNVSDNCCGDIKKVWTLMSAIYRDKRD